MSANQLIGEPLCEFDLDFLKVVDYGIPLAALTLGAPLPSYGVRVDVTLRGKVRGRASRARCRDRLRGTSVPTVGSRAPAQGAFREQTVAS
jgi:hypothetical protein